MMGLIESQDMYGFLNRELHMPPRKIREAATTNSNSEVVVNDNPDFTAWKRSDSLLRGWITATLLEEVLGLIVGLDTSTEVWQALVDSFAQESQEREFYLLQNWRCIQRKIKLCQNNIGLFQNYCDELAAIGKPIDDHNKVFGILKGLGRGYVCVLRNHHV